MREQEAKDRVPLPAALQSRTHPNLTSDRTKPTQVCANQQGTNNKPQVAPVGFPIVDVDAVRLVLERDGAGGLRLIRLPLKLKESLEAGEIFLRILKGILRGIQILGG